LIGGGDVDKYAKYSGIDNDKVPKRDYIDKLSGMTDRELYEESYNMVYLSSYAVNNIRSDYHWKVDACRDECDRREGDIFNTAFDECRKDN
jgi:hypothetical protein